MSTVLFPFSDLPLCLKEPQEIIDDEWLSHGRKWKENVKKVENKKKREDTETFFLFLKISFIVITIINNSVFNLYPGEYTHIDSASFNVYLKGVLYTNAKE